MRHANKVKKLGRTHAHRKATMAALSSALIEHKRITTTLPKAKALRTFVEPIINRAKEDTTHNRRQVFRRLQSKEAVKALFGEIAEVLGDRPGGYTRVVKLGQRAGDAAEMAIIELVDFNDVQPEGSTTKKKTRRSSRRRSSGSGAAAVASQAEAAEVAPEAVEAEVATEPVVEEAVEVVEEAEAAAEEEAVTAEAEVADEPVAETVEVEEPAAVETVEAEAETVAIEAEAAAEPEAEETAAPADEAPEADAEAEEDEKTD